MRFDDGEELFRRERARFVKDGCREIFIDCGRAALPVGVSGGVALFECRPVDLELAEDECAFLVIPPVGEHDSAHVEEDCVKGEVRRSS